MQSIWLFDAAPEKVARKKKEKGDRMPKKLPFWVCRIRLAILIAAFVGTTPGGTAHAQDAELDQKVVSAVQECQRISASCATEIKNAVGVLVFPSVTRADLIIGGSGGRGALIENNHITGYYTLGSGSIGLQAGVDEASQVYAFRSPQALASLKASPDWKVGASAGVTVVSAADKNTNAVTGDVLTYIFDSKGLHGGISVDMLDIWKTGQQRP